MYAFVKKAGVFTIELEQLVARANALWCVVSTRRRSFLLTFTWSRKV